MGLMDLSELEAVSDCHTRRSRLKSGKTEPWRNRWLGRRFAVFNSCPSHVQKLTVRQRTSLGHWGHGDGNTKVEILGPWNTCALWNSPGTSHTGRFSENNFWTMAWNIATFTLRQRRWKLPIPNPALVSSLRCYRLLQWIQVSNENEKNLGLLNIEKGRQNLWTTLWWTNIAMENGHL